MAKRLFQVPSFTATATGDSTSALANGTYMGLRGGSGTQIVDLLEVLITGLGAASAPTIMQVARSGAIASTTTLLVTPNSDGPADFSTAALAAPPLTFVAAVGGPQRSASIADARLNVGLNAFGGIIRWNAAPTQQWTIIGNTASGGESTLAASNASGGASGAVQAHILYEPH